MRVLLTGGAGGIGIHVIAHLLQNTDWHIVLLDSFRHKGYNARLQVLFTDHPDWVERVTILQHDLVCPISPELRQKIGDVNHILHLAALSDVQFSVENPVYVIKNNVDSTLTMLEYAKITPHDSFIYFSTDEVYGPVEKGQAHKEDSPYKPSNAYAASKAAGELFARTYWRAGQVKLIITNTMNNYGEMQGSAKFPSIVQSLVNKGETVPIHGNDKEIGTRFYIHSRNTADAVLYILNNLPPSPHKQGEIDDPDRYHIVGQECLSNLELAQKIAELMGKKLKFEMKDFHKDNPAHDIHYGLEDNRLREAGWVQPVDFETSLKNTIDWQQVHEEWL